jgi:hypothetical protein
MNRVIDNKLYFKRTNLTWVMTGLQLKIVNDDRKNQLGSLSQIKNQIHP